MLQISVALLASYLAGTAMPMAGTATRGRSTRGAPHMLGNMFKMIEDMPGAKAGALIETYKTRIDGIRSK